MQSTILGMASKESKAKKYNQPFYYSFQAILRWILTPWIWKTMQNSNAKLEQLMELSLSGQDMQL